MKKLTALLLVMAMVLALGACASSDTAAPPAAEPAAPAAEPAAPAAPAAEPAAPAAEPAAPAAEPAAPAAEPAAPAAEPTSLKIGVSIMELTAYTWFQGVIDGCNNWLADNGASKNVTMDFDFEDSHSDVATMLNNVENMIAAGSDGVILFPADASSAIPTMKQAVANGIPFIVCDYAQETQSDADVVWSTFVGHDMKALGVKAGKVAVDYLKTLGKDDPTCLFITVPSSGQVSADRFNGFKETVQAEFPNARFIEEGDTGAHNRDSAQTLTENVLQREPVIDVVCGHNDAEVVGAYNAAVQQGRSDMKFIGIAGDIDVLKWITEGNEYWLGEVLQDPVVLGYQATDAIYRVLVNGETLEPKYELPEPEAITPANVSNYDWQNWGWLG